LGFLFFAAGRVCAEDACGTLKLQGGQVHTGKPISADFSGTPAGKQCLSDIAKELLRNRLVRAVTVAYRVPESQRQSVSTLAVAKSLAEVLITSGLPRNRVFAVAPHAEDNEPVSLVIRYTERAPDNVVARIAGLSGTVRLGADEANLRPAEPAMPLLADDLIQTGSDGLASIVLKDGSGLRLVHNTQIKMTQVSFSEGGDRSVHVEVLRGQIEADVRRAGQGSNFDASSRVAVASVRGTVFRFGGDPQGISRLETLQGHVGLGSAVNPATPKVEVPTGQGSRALPSGKVEPPQPLPAAPLVVAPLHGPLPESATLSWRSVPDATSYRVEVARDPDFLLAVSEYNTEQPAYVLQDRLPAGKWFWRVTTQSTAGFYGAPSKVYAFEIAP
jgi:hypothetical protein